MAASTPPSAWITRFAPAVRPAGRVLDLACGAGRHTRLFAARGHHVTAVDADLAGVADLTGEPGIRLVAADLEEGHPWPLDGVRFDAVVVTNYLHRPIFPDILAAVDPGGMLLYETFARGNERFGRPRNPDFLLEPGELLELVRGHLRVVAFEQGVVSRPKEAVVQRLCAVRSDDAEVPLDLLLQ